MALLRQREAVASWDFLGKRDESCRFQGNTHRSLALKFLLDIKQQHKQLLFFYGEVGSGKTRLAKATARELASKINESGTPPLLYLFLLDCERYNKEGDLDITEIQSHFAQTLKMIDEDLSEELSKCKLHEFSFILSNYLSKRDRIFLFLLDGVTKNVGVILSFLENVINTNENVLLFVTSSTHLELPRLARKVSSYTCGGLTPEAARTLLREVAGHPPELAQDEEEIVSLCHMNPFLIMRVGLQMRSDSNFQYSPGDMKDLLNHSVALAVSGGNVPEKDDFFKRELELARKLTRDMGRNMVTVLNQPEHSFSAEHIAETLKEPTPAVVKKAYLQDLVSNSIVSQADCGLFSLNELFTEFFREQRILINSNADDFVEQIYNELMECLGRILSTSGVEKMFMIHRSEMDHIRAVERRITGIQRDGLLMKNLGRSHFINVCATFLKNIPLTTDIISEFTEKCFVILNTYDRQEQFIINSSLSEFDISEQLNEMVITDQATRRSEAQFERKGGFPQANKKESKEVLAHPSDEESSVTRFGIEVASPFSKVSGFSSLASSEDSVRGLASNNAPELSTMPYKDPSCVQYFPLRHFELGAPVERSSGEPEEVSFHDFSIPRQQRLNDSQQLGSSSSSQPQEVSFHNFSLPEQEMSSPDEQSWPIGVEDHNRWSTEGNPPTTP